MMGVRPGVRFVRSPELLDKVDQALKADGSAGYSLGDLVESVLAGEVQVWEKEDAVLISEIHDMPQARSIHFWIAAGDMDSVMELSEVAMAWAKQIGCTEATLNGRKGWERVLAPEWRAASTVLHRGL